MSLWELTMRHLILVLLLLVGACSLPPADAGREAQVDQAFEAVKRDDHAALDAMATDALKVNLSDETVAAMSDYVPEETPEHVRTVSWQSSAYDGNEAYRILRQYEFSDATVIFDAVLARAGSEPWKIDGVHINRVSSAQAALGRFSLVNKSPAHYGVLLLVGLAPIVCLGTAVVAGLRRRWGWVIFSLFGIGQFVFNWGTGAFQFQVLYFSFLSAGFLKGPLVTDPWMFSFGLPIPALLFWGLGKWKPKTPKALKAQAAPSDPL